MRQLVLDLGVYKEWQQARQSHTEREKVSIFYDEELDYIESSATILLRAVIFDRIGKLQAAITLYRQVLQHFSDQLTFDLKIFALFRLMRIYKRTRYDMASAARFVEIIDAFSQEYNIEHWDVIPLWLQNTIFKLVADFGACRYEQGFAEQNRIGERVLIGLLQRAKLKNITGSKT